MTYTAFNSVNPSQVTQGPVTGQNPYFKSTCGCGSGTGNMTMPAHNMHRENFTAQNGGNTAPMKPVTPNNPPMCSLSSSAPPAGCCHPAPLHCSDCGCGFFKASEAYGS